MVALSSGPPGAPSGRACPDGTAVRNVQMRTEMMTCASYICWDCIPWLKECACDKIERLLPACPSERGSLFSWSERDWVAIQQAEAAIK